MTWLQEEIEEQPAVAARLLESVVPRLGELAEALGGANGITVAARGSSDNAARYAQYLWGARLRMPVTLALPSLTTVYGRPPRLVNQAVVAVSQSGASPDVVSFVDDARAAGVPTLAVTNEPRSALARAAANVVDLQAGPERSVAATKTYTGSLLALALVGFALEPGPARAERGALERVPAALDAAVRHAEGVAEAARFVSGFDRAVCVGRGLNLATAHEIALKLTELSGILVAPYSPADLLHGPVAAVGPDVPVILVVPDEPASESVLQLVPELHRRGAPVVLVGPARIVAGTEAAHRLVLPDAAVLPGWLSPLTAVVAGQLLAWRVAEARGVEVDRPGQLSKVTLTR